MLAVVTVACGDGGGGTPVDATPPTLSYRISVSEEQPTRADPPVVFIDGMQQTDLVIDYPDRATAAKATHDIELHAGSAVVASLMLDVGAAFDACSPFGSAVTVVSLEEEICDFESGDLRFAADDCTTLGGGGGVGDGFCIARCQSDAQCGSGMRCATVVASVDPLYSHLDCAPIGSAAVGAACTFTAGSSGMYDDCGSGAVCLAGTCVEQCTGSTGCGSGSCSFVDGEPLPVCS